MPSNIVAKIIMLPDGSVHIALANRESVIATVNSSQLLKQGVDVASLYKELGDYKDSKEKYSSILYERAVKYMESDTLATKTKAFGLLNEISTYKDSADRVQSLLYELYSGAVNAFNQKKFDEAKEIFAILKEHSYKDSADRYAECDPAKAAEEARIQAEREAEAARKKAEAEAEAARKAAEASKIAEEKNKIVGTWYSSNAWPWGVTIRFTQSGMMQYKLGDDKDWSRQESFTYNTSTGKYGFKWVSHSYTATLSGNKLTVKGNDADAPFFVGSYSRIS